MLEKVRVGVIGMGMGRNHAVHFRDCPQAELIAICDADPGRLAEKAHELHPHRTYTQYEELLADPEIDAVSVALPNFLHAPVTLAALEAGKHVLCEKPLAMNTPEAERMVETARRLGRTLMVHFNTRFHPASMALKRAIDEGALGHVYFAKTLWHRKRGIPGIGGWFTRKEMSGGGALIDLGVHRLDLALWLMGYPRPVSVTGNTYNYLGTQQAEREGKTFNVDDLAAAFIRFENGASLVLETSWASNSERREDQWTQLFGIEGGAIMRNLHEGYEYQALLLRNKGDDVWHEFPPAPEPHENAQEHFCRALLSGTETMSPGEQGLMVTRILDAIYESAATGYEVRLS